MTMCQSIRGASAFSDSGEYFENQMKAKGENVVNFIPVRDSSKGRIKADDSILSGLDVFRVDPKSEPSTDQVREIWFAFNVICNYVFNKNLMPGGRPDKFIYWVENAQKGYPTNPYMCLFLSLAHVLKGDLGKAAELRAEAIEYSQSEYWRDRFKAFGLDTILGAELQTKQQAYDVLCGFRGLAQSGLRQHTRRRAAGGPSLTWSILRGIIDRRQNREIWSHVPQSRRARGMYITTTSFNVTAAMTLSVFLRHAVSRLESTTKP
jgi:hypothetical protein